MPSSRQPVDMLIGEGWNINLSSCSQRASTEVSERHYVRISSLKGNLNQYCPLLCSYIDGIIDYSPVAMSTPRHVTILSREIYVTRY